MVKKQDKKRQRLYLIDGSNYIFRAYHAIRSSLSNSKGMPTNAIYGYTQMLRKILKSQKPTHCAVAFDLGPPTKRLEMYPMYKANRPETPEEIKIQWPYCRDLTEALGVTIIEKAGIEADDLIGTIARKAESKGFDVTIVTSDKDFYQLVGQHIDLWDTMKDRRIGVSEVEERFGVFPDHVVDVLGLMGDSVDNVPGVPGIGEKTAKLLVQEFGDVEALLGRLEELKPGKQRDRLKENVELARLSVKLVTIDTEVAIRLGIDDLEIGGLDRDRMTTLLKELEFRGLAEEILGGFRQESVPDKKYTTILDGKDLDTLIKKLKKSDGFAIDLETTDKKPMWAKIVGFALSCKSNEGYYVPVKHDYEGAPKQLSIETVLEKLSPLLKNSKLPKYGQNIKYDMLVMDQAGVQMEGIAFDTMLASYVSNPARRGHSMDELSREHLDHQPISYKDVVGSGGNERTFNQVEIKTATRYSAEDADITWSLVDILSTKLDTCGTRSTFDNLEVPLIPVLVDMEKTGVLIDLKLMSTLEKKLKTQLETALQRIHEIAGRELNPNSPVQLREILFDKLRLHEQAPPSAIRKTKTGMSTNAEVLEKLALLHPLPKEILEYRELSKLQSTYVQALPKLVHPETGRIHTSFNQTVAATGRLSSADPNLQNIPVRTDMGRQIRKAFIPKSGWKMLSADYSQVELRILAHLSDDKVLRKAFTENEDIHERTALEVTGVLPGTITSEMRRMAKAVNYGVIYGISPFGLSQNIGVPVDEARRFIESYFERYEGVREFINDTLDDARKKGYVETLRGRRRPIPDISQTNKNLRSFAERTAVNTLMQGTAADIIKKAMLKIHSRLKKEKLKSRMILQVHDELVFEGPPGEIDKLVILVQEEMEGAETLSIPLIVETKIGNNWDEAH